MRESIVARRRTMIRPRADDLPKTTVSEWFPAGRIRRIPHLQSFQPRRIVRPIAARGAAMVEANNDRDQRQETTDAARSSALRTDGDPHSAVLKRLAAVASELRKASETADGAREGLLKLALRFEQHALGDNQ